MGDINTEIKKLEVQTQWYEDQYNKYYPPQGHTTEEVIHLDLATGERTQEERSRIESPVERDYIRFKNAVKIEFLKLIKRDINRHIIRARIPSREERLALETRAARIIQEAQEKAEADFQKLVSVELPRQLAKYAKAEHAEFIGEKLQASRQWLKDSYKPWLDFERYGAEELVIHMMGSDVIRTQAEAFLKNRLAERITTVRYVEHLAALADEREPAKKQEATTKIWALVYKYRREDEAHLYNIGKTAMIDIGVKLGLSGDAFYNTFKEVCKDYAKLPKPEHIRKAMEYLADFPKALKKAEEELLSIEKEKGNL